MKEVLDRVKLTNSNRKVNMTENTENTGIGTPPMDDDVEILNDTGDKSLIIAKAQGLVDEESNTEDEDSSEDTTSESQEEDESDVDAEIEDITAEDQSEQVKPKGAFDAQKQKWQAKVKAKEDQIAFLMQELQKRSTPDTPPPVVVSDEPTLDDFGGDIKAYAKAAIAYETNKARQEAEFTSKATTFKQRQAEYIKTNPKFNEVMEDANDHPAAQATCHELRNAILEEEVGPAMQFYYASNLDKLEALNSMTPTKRLMEIGRVIERLQTKAAPKPRVVTNAPAPVKPVTGSAPKATKNLYEMDADQVEAYLEEQERKNPRLRRR